jgi:hypothetical protein
VAGYHHRPVALGDQHRQLVTLVYVADTICCAGQHGFNRTALHQKLDDAGLSDMKLDRALIDRTAANLGSLIEAASTLLT